MVQEMFKHKVSLIEPKKTKPHCQHGLSCHNQKLGPNIGVATEKGIEKD
jgi:hypothetical protein